MAVFKANYTRKGRDAKASIRYIETRPGHEREKTTRPLFGIDGVMTRKEAYSLINDAHKGSVFFRFIISPDPSNEDSNRDLDLRDVTQQTMLALDERIKRGLQWVAAEHNDHSPNRHVHIVAVLPKGTRLNEKDLEQLRLEATDACLEQRQTLDLVLGITREQAADSTCKRHRYSQSLRSSRPSQTGLFMKQFMSGNIRSKGVTSLRPKTCFCYHCGLRQAKSYFGELQHCLRCGSEIEQGRKIILVKEEGWER